MTTTTDNYGLAMPADTPDAKAPAEYDHPFSGRDLVLAQVGWRDRETGRFYNLGEYVHDPITVEEAAKPMYLRAVYEIAGRHYRDPAP